MALTFHHQSFISFPLGLDAVESATSPGKLSVMYTSEEMRDFRLDSNWREWRKDHRGTVLELGGPLGAESTSYSLLERETGL